MTSQHSAAPTLHHLAMLLKRTAGRDARAFNELHALTCNKLRKTAVGVCPGSSDIEDILQETYLRIWHAAASFDVSRASPITWMCTIVRNVALDAVRRKKLSLTDLDEAMLVPAPFEESDGFDYVLAKRIADDALRGLPEERRKLVSLAYFEGMSRQALARQFGVPVGTIKTWLRRALEGVQVECLAAARKANPA
jgi:RNA polymerase sigma-70 factor, ECF subfamily